MADPNFVVNANPDTQMFGVKLASLVAGFAGGVVSLSFVRQLTRAQSALAVFTGAATAAYGTPVIAHFLSIQPDMEYSVAFFTGLTAMNIIPGVIELSRAFRKNPSKFLGRGQTGDEK